MRLVLALTIMLSSGLALGQVTYDTEHQVGTGALVASAGETSPYAFQVSAAPGEIIRARVRACDPSPTNCSAFSAWTSVVAGGMQPLPDLNGYTATSQNPIVFPGDGCDPAWTGPMCITYPVITGTPTCTGASGVNPNDATQYVIRDAAGWARINTGAETVFAVCAGDYTALAPFTLQRSGTANTDAGLVKIVYYSDDPAYDPRLNAYRRRMGEGDGGTAQIARLSIDDKRDFVLIAGITIKSPTPTANAGVNQPFFNAPHKAGIYFDRIEFDSTNYTSNNSFALRAMNDGVVQNSVLGPCHLKYEFDNNMLWTHEYNENTPRIVNNEMFDCTHHIPTGGNAQGGTAPGGTMENNDLYYTTRHYTSECSRAYWSGRYAVGQSIPLTDPGFDTNGNCMCAESQISIKHGSAAAGNPLVVSNNRSWGNRPTNNLGCGQTGADRGHHVETLQDAGNTLLEKNVFFGGQAYIVQRQDAGAFFGNIVWQNNDFYELELWDTSFRNPRIMGSGTPDAGNPVTFTNNRFGAVPAVGDIADPGLNRMDFHCNVFFDSRGFATSGPNLVGNENVSLESTPGTSPLPNSFANTGTVAFDAAEHQDRTVYIQLQTTPSTTPLASWPKLVLTDSIPTASAGYPPCTLP